MLTPVNPNTNTTVAITNSISITTNNGNRTLTTQINPTDDNNHFGKITLTYTMTDANHYIQRTMQFSFNQLPSTDPTNVFHFHNKIMQEFMQPTLRLLQNSLSQQFMQSIFQPSSEPTLTPNTGSIVPFQQNRPNPINSSTIFQMKLTFSILSFFENSSQQNNILSNSFGFPIPNMNINNGLVLSRSPNHQTPSFNFNFGLPNNPLPNNMLQSRPFISPLSSITFQDPMNPIENNDGNNRNDNEAFDFFRSGLQSLMSGNLFSLMNREVNIEQTTIIDLNAGIAVRFTSIEITDSSFIGILSNSMPHSNHVHGSPNMQNHSFELSNMFE